MVGSQGEHGRHKCPGPLQPSLMTSGPRGGRSPSPWCPWASGQVAGMEEPVWLVWVFLSGNLEVSGKRAEASLVHEEAPEP